MRVSRLFAVLLIAAAVVATCEFAPADEISSQDEAAIRKATADFVAAFNQGDSEAMAKAWTDTGDYVGDSGQIVRFRDQISKRQQDSARAALPELTMSVESLRQVAKDVALVHGASMLKTGGRTTHGGYLAVWLRQEGKWTIESIREAKIPVGSPHTVLSQLSWMLGEWTAEDKEMSVETSVAWSADGNFLLREFRIRAPGRAEHTGVQRLGWDPLAEQFRSWVFLSDGSFTEGAGDAGVNSLELESSGGTADGKRSVSTTRYTKIDENTLSWESLDATIDGEPLPDLKVRLVRKGSR